MDTQHIITALESERDRIANAIAILSNGSTPRRRGRRGRRHLTTAEKMVISEAMKKKWAERRKAKN